MRKTTSQEEATLLDILIDGFEKNEVLRGYHWRDLPMPDESAAARKFDALAGEARRWKGAPIREEVAGPRRIVSWPDLEIRQCGRGILVRVRAPWFTFWNERQTWRDDPMGAVHDWLAEEAERAR